MRLKTARAQFLVECLELPEAAQVDDAVWEQFQLDHLNDDSVFRIEEKARQIAWSFTVAAEAMANAILDGESTIFVSINLVEAQEKIRYARSVYDNLDIAELPLFVVENKLQLELTNGGRLISRPSTPPRGRARMNVVLDEFAHVQRDKEIYTAALPIISKGGRIRIGSSPMGATGSFWEIARQQLRDYPGYVRVVTPWWRCKAFCGKHACPSPGVAEAMVTGERVGRFGNDRIQMIFNNMDLDSFQQEYECLYVDDAVSFFDWPLIKKNQDGNLKYWHFKTPDILDSLHEIKGCIADGAIEPHLVAGVDIGRRKNLTEIMVLGVNGTRPVRIMVSLDRVEFDTQEKCIRDLVRTLPISACLIDQNGIGMQLAENLERDTCCQGATFTNASKALWANELKIEFERKGVPLPADKNLAYQIHSIKKKITAANNAVYDTDGNEKHHADKFWALALANWAGREYADAPEWGTAPTWKRR